MAVIGMGVADALQIMKIKVIDYTFRKVIEHFMCSQSAHGIPDVDTGRSYGDLSCEFSHLLKSKR